MHAFWLLPISSTAILISLFHATHDPDYISTVSLPTSSPTHSGKQVAEGLRRFGITAKSTSAILVKIGPQLSKPEKKDLQDEMQALTGGTLASLDGLANDADLSGLKKVSSKASCPGIRDFGADAWKQIDVQAGEGCGAFQQAISQSHSFE